MCRNYEGTDNSCYISKDNLFREATDYFKVSETASNKRIFFEIIGRHIFGKIPQFMSINLKSKKQIRGLRKRGLPPSSTAAESARDQNATEIKCKIKNDGSDDGNERKVNSKNVSEDIKGVAIDPERKLVETGGNKKEKIGVEVQNERTVHGGGISEDIEGVIANIEIEQTGGNKKHKIGKEDKKERNVHSGAVSEDNEVDDCLEKNTFC